MLDCWDYIPHKSNSLTPAMPPATAVKAHRYLVARTEPCCKNPLSENHWNPAGFQAPSFRWGLLTVFENTRRAPAKERRLVFVQQSSKSYGYFSKRQEISLIFCAKTLPVRSSQAAEPEARRSHRNWKRYTPLRHVPERILPYMLCLQYF